MDRTVVILVNTTCQELNL